MLKVLLIFDISVLAGSIALAVVLGVPYDWIIGTVLLVEVVPVGTFGAAVILREMKRGIPQGDWTHPAPRQRLPQSRHPQLEAPQQRMIEAQGKELTLWHSGD